jgi:hypothetical protein
MSMNSRLIAGSKGRRAFVRQKNVKRWAVQDDIAYRLQVVTRIRRKDLGTIYRMGPELISLIENGGVKLLLSCWEEAGTDEIDIYNYWDLGNNANTLFQLELTIPDEPAYAKFDQLILREDKTILVPIPDLPPFSPTPYDRSVRRIYLRATYQVETKNLAEFGARLEGSVGRVALENRWSLGGVHIGLTGRSNELTQIWAIPEESIALAQRRLTGIDWQELVREPPIYQILEPTPADPLLRAPVTKTSVLVVNGFPSSAAPPVGSNKSQGNQQQQQQGVK